MSIGKRKARLLQMGYPCLASFSDALELRPPQSTLLPMRSIGKFATKCIRNLSATISAIRTRSSAPRDMCMHSPKGTIVAAVFLGARRECTALFALRCLCMHRSNCVRGRAGFPQIRRFPQADMQSEAIHADQLAGVFSPWCEVAFCKFRPLTGSEA